MKLFFNTIIILFTAFSLSGQSAPITIDGVFEDWTSSLSGIVDEVESVSGVDLLEFQVTNDEEFLFIKIIFDTELNLKEDDPVSHSIFLDIDTDNNPNTGFSAQEGYGAELSVDFSNRFAYYNVAPSTTVNFSDFKARFAPTVTSNTFEIAIGRTTIPNGIHPLFTSQTIRILFRNGDTGDALPNAGTVFSYTFDETPVPALIPTDINKENPELIRIVAYNTQFDGLENNSRVDNFRNMIKSLQPDIIGFSECNNTNASTVRSLMNAWLPLENAQGWQILKNGDLITASRWPYLNNWPFLYRQFPVLIDLPEEYSTDLLFTNAHLRCCGNNEGRQEQVDEYAAFMLDAKSEGGSIDLPENTPFVYAGDLNLVGYSQQLTTLLTGDIQDTGTFGQGGALDWDDTSLTDEICVHTDKRMTYTWRNDGSQFPPGRLDFIIFSDAVMTVEKSFALQTAVMSEERLAFYNLNSWDATEASDHFPVTADFSIDILDGVSVTALGIPVIYPNPVNGDLTIGFEKEGDYKIYLMDALGRIVLKEEVLGKEAVIDLTKLLPGIYFVDIKEEGGGVYRSKVIVQ